MKVITNNNPKKLELIDPVNGLWAVRWNIKNLDETTASCNLKVFKHKPSLREIQDYLTSDISKECKLKIIGEFVWNNHPVYLNTENLQNFSTAYTAAINDPSNVPITLKLGTYNESEYYTFNSIEELKDFYSSMSKHISSCLKECWETKSNINLEEYK